jgi:hypothetical protein
LLENEAVWFSRPHVLALFVSVATVYGIGMIFNIAVGSAKMRRVRNFVTPVTQLCRYKGKMKIYYRALVPSFSCN